MELYLSRKDPSTRIYIVGKGPTPKSPRWKQFLYTMFSFPQPISRFFPFGRKTNDDSLGGKEDSEGNISMCY